MEEFLQQSILDDLQVGVASGSVCVAALRVHGCGIFECGCMGQIIMWL